ncbi:MAG: LuxR family transcriptional regulator [Flavobacteriaceae bacterium]|nr:LuxR family transcriptional regulator [Flavobacteriaceae bacterium]|tara:strand:- start:38857 stop:41658 length:2802 start_codon:yes stop_codon:yes gene_type:complete
MNHNISFLLRIVLFVSISISAQEIPPLQTFTPEDYHAENQNWSVTQDQQKTIYIANNKGLLEFNGDSWELYPTPNESIMRSVLFHKGLIFSGFYKDFGYWKRDEFGALNYTSIAEKFDLDMLEDEQIWEIFDLGDWMLFKSLQRIYLINLKLGQTKVIHAKNNLSKLTKIGEMFYFQDYLHGIYKIENGEPILISSNSDLKNNKVVQFYKIDNVLYALTQSAGIYSVDNKTVKKDNNTLSKNLRGFSIYSALKTNNDEFVVGTISNGLLYFSKDGTLLYRINQNNGLLNNTILSIFQDRDENIWLGLDKGIGLVNLKSNYQFYNDKNGSLGTVYTSIKFDGNLYLGTNQGLFYKREGSRDDYTIIPNTLGQVWSLSIHDEKLFCGHDKGTLIVSGSKARLISNVLGAWLIRKIDDTTLLQGNYDGLYILKKRQGQWSYSHKIKNYSTSSKQFELLDSRTLFINHEYKGVFQLKLSEDLQRVIQNDKVASISKGLHSSLTKYNDKMLYASKEGVYVFNKDQNTFEKDSIYSQLIPLKTFESAKLVHDTFQNRLWSFTSEGLRYLSPGSLSSSYQIHKVPISGTLIKGASGYENIISLNQNKYLLGTSNGYVTIDLDAPESPDQFFVGINKVGAYEIDKEIKYANITAENEFDPESNNIIFNCSVNNFNKTYLKKYSYKLDGYNEVWNELKNSNKIVYENLSPGTYTLRLNAYLNDVKSSNEVQYQFRIKKPWYASNGMRLVYLALFGLILYSIHLITRKYYQKQRAQILERTQKELELKELENSKQIIKLNNEKLRNDIEGKNRELATSTMSIIKKNEFLNEIKNELVNGGEKRIDKVIRIIDKDLNNTDDWKLFQEAFNNADKKFLRKIKTKHPDLTPNDLRLCAYLRLNLSSKEIAPLLNISPRSVEVKRYRLRKKMNLDHDINLTNYIIDI